MDASTADPWTQLLETPTMCAVENLSIASASPKT